MVHNERLYKKSVKGMDDYISAHDLAEIPAQGSLRDAVHAAVDADLWWWSGRVANVSCGVPEAGKPTLNEDAQRMAILRTCLSPPVQRTVGRILNDPKFYSNALAALTERYGKIGPCLQSLHIEATRAASRNGRRFRKSKIVSRRNRKLGLHTKVEWIRVRAAVQLSFTTSPFKAY